MSERRLVTLALFVATFLVALDASVVSTAMPTVIGQIGGIRLYALGLQRVSADQHRHGADLRQAGRPVRTQAGLSGGDVALFMVGSMLCGQSQSMEQLIAFRLLQGLGAGGVLPITQTILGDVFPLDERARITGLFSTVWGVSGLLGPGIGGFLTEHVSWRWVFYVNLPLCVLSIALIGTLLHERIERRRHSIDYLGALSLSAAVTLLLIGLQITDNLALADRAVRAGGRAGAGLRLAGAARARAAGAAVAVRPALDRHQHAGRAAAGLRAVRPEHVSAAVRPGRDGRHADRFRASCWPARRSPGRLPRPIGGRLLLSWGFRRAVRAGRRAADGRLRAAADADA